MKSRERRWLVILLAAALAAALLAGCGTKTESNPPQQNFGSAASDAAAKMLDLTSYATTIRFDFTFIHASHGDDASEELQATVAGPDYQLSRVSSGMGLSWADQWLYSGKILYTGDGTTWQAVAKNATNVPLPPGGLLDDMSSFDVTGQGPDSESLGSHAYIVTCKPDVVWAWAPVWIRDLDANLDFSCKGTIYLGTADGLTRRIFLRLEGNDKQTGVLKISVNLDASYSHFNDPAIAVTNPASQTPAPTPGS